ncbi:hypothetical protein C8Q75DRAFT_768363 [Abortiporus biennis]|nr:hypothetical protein C8Q75DRAFT_768363 [Abortiporus biennis]
MASSRFQTVSNSTTTDPPPPYSFLQYPPKKQAPNQPLPFPPSYTSSADSFPNRGGSRRASMTATITAWVENVQPGSPAPHTPPPQGKGRSTRRASVVSVRVSSKANYANENSDSPSSTEFKPDLEALGYASNFMNHGMNAPKLPPLPKGKDSKEKRKSFSLKPSSSSGPNSEGQFSKASRHLRSLSLKPRAKHSDVPLPPPSAPLDPLIPIPPPHRSSRTRTQSTNGTSSSATKHYRDRDSGKEKDKRMKYSDRHPATLATDLAMAQFLDGGHLEDHIRTYTHKHAKAAGVPQSVTGEYVGVDDVYRDEDGTVWRDRDEALEYAHLLSGDREIDLNEVEWVPFGPHPDEGEGEERRGSVSTQDSDLDPRYTMMEVDDVNDDQCTLIVPPSRLPAKHFRKPDAFPSIPSLSSDSPTTPTLRTPHSHISQIPSVEERTRGLGVQRKFKPAPLNLTPAVVSPVIEIVNPQDSAAQGKKEFLASSFEPQPIVPTAEVANKKPKGKAPMVNVKGFFKAVGKRMN